MPRGRKQSLRIYRFEKEIRNNSGTSRSFASGAGEINAGENKKKKTKLSVHSFFCIIIAIIIMIININIIIIIVLNQRKFSIFFMYEKLLTN